MLPFLGGPLHFLPELRKAFVRTLHLTPEQTIAPDHSHLFAAVGAAMNPKEGQEPVRYYRHDRPAFQWH